MNKENTQRLFEKYPEIFKGTNLPMTQNLMCFGFECGDGWYDIIDTLCLRIMRLCEAFNAPIPMAFQVKEKFGGLRFYTENISKEVADFIYLCIEDAERESKETCEVCGEYGHLRYDGWIRPLCKKHAIEEGRELTDYEKLQEQKSYGGTA